MFRTDNFAVAFFLLDRKFVFINDNLFTLCDDKFTLSFPYWNFIRAHVFT